MDVVPRVFAIFGCHQHRVVLGYVPGIVVSMSLWWLLVLRIYSPVVSHWL